MLSAVAFALASETAMASALPVSFTGRYSWRLLPCIPAQALHQLSDDWRLLVRFERPPVYRLMSAACQFGVIGGDEISL